MLDNLPKPQQLTEIAPYTGAFANAQSFEAAQRMAKALCSSTLVPKEYQGVENIGNAIIALEVSQRLRASPLMIMQNLYIVHGKPAWSSQMVIAALQACGRYEPLTFNMVGEPHTDRWGCYVTTTVKATGETIQGPTITIAMSKAEGWYQKNGSKWKTLPELMLRYRAASWFGRQYAPDILMGMQTVDEVKDVIDLNPVTGEVVDTVSAVADINKTLTGGDSKPETTPIVDANGEVWDAEKHATGADGGPVYNKDGTFRARRGSAKQHAHEQPTQLDEKPTSGHNITVDYVADLIADAASMDDLDAAEDLLGALDGFEEDQAKLATSIRIKRESFA